MGEAARVKVVLVVGTDARRSEAIAKVLRSDGRDVIVATTFEKARALLASSPDLLITDIQLGAYNGLHLVWQRYYDDPTQPSIVISAYPDPVLEIEASRLGCPFLVAPVQPHEILTAVSVLLGFDRDTFDQETEDDKRRWPRTSVGARAQGEAGARPRLAG